MMISQHQSSACIQWISRRCIGRRSFMAIDHINDLLFCDINGCLKVSNLAADPLLTLTCQRLRALGPVLTFFRLNKATSYALLFNTFAASHGDKMNCTESLAARMSQLSLQDPRSTIKTLVGVHQELITALQEADAFATQGSSAGAVLSEFQRITGCRRTEAQFYLKQSCNDIRWVSLRCSAAAAVCFCVLSAAAQAVHLPDCR